ncbi:MAG: CPBP family intramembrane metalloprotease [Chloroflexi bacterium]|nr:CPBP family intramembrane metalloprotease [Chloroflexota bacterium]
MFHPLSDRMKATGFYLTAVTSATVVAVLVSAFHKPALLDYVMFTPLLAMLLMLLVVTRDGYSRAGWRILGLQRAGLRSWPMALLLPLLVLACSFETATLLGVARWQWPAGAAWSQFGANLLAGLLFNTLFALGEEIGWRGYLLPKLLPLGPVRAALLGGFLHGLWHLPMILLTPFYHGDGNRWIVVPLFLLTLSVGGIFYSYLRLTSDSVWPVALGHGAFNLFWGIFTDLAVPVAPLAMAYLSGESGILTLIFASLAIGFLIQRLKGNGIKSTKQTVTRQPVAAH